MIDYKNNIIKYLIKIRKTKGLTVYRLSKLSGISEATLRGAENECKDICISTLIKWCHALDLQLIIEPHE